MTRMPEPGWYDEPNGPGEVRWWDGEAWTEHRSGPDESDRRLTSRGGRRPWPMIAAALVVLGGAVTIYLATWSPTRTAASTTTIARYVGPPNQGSSLLSGLAIYSYCWAGNTVNGTMTVLGGSGSRISQPMMATPDMSCVRAGVFASGATVDMTISGNYAEGGTTTVTCAIERNGVVVDTRTDQEPGPALAECSTTA